MSTLKIAHLADSHFDEKHRLDDNVAVHGAFVDQAKAAGVDVILHAGDFFERRSTPAERNALLRFLCEAADVAPVVGCKGNHDADDDLTVFNRLDTRHGVEIFERPGISGDNGSSLGGVPLALSVLALPWFTKAGVVARLAADVPSAESTEATISAARRLLAMLSVQVQERVALGTVPLLVGHVLVAGSETSTGQTLIGSTVELAPADLAELGCAYAALGHIHKRQSWNGDRVAYSGSPNRQNFGEPEAKGWNLVEIDTARWREPGGVAVSFQELPARRIVLLEEDWTGGSAHWHDTRGDLSGALVRVRYSIKPEDLHLVDDAGVEAAIRARGAHDVKLEPVLVHQDRVRCAEIAKAETTFDKLRAFWVAKGIDVPEANRVRIREKLEQLEARAQEVAV